MIDLSPGIQELIQHFILIGALFALIYSISKIFEIFFQEFMEYTTNDRTNPKQSTEQGEKRD